MQKEPLIRPENKIICLFKNETVFRKYKKFFFYLPELCIAASCLFVAMN